MRRRVKPRVPESAATRDAKRAHGRELRVLHACLALDVGDTGACLSIAARVLKRAREASGRWGRLEARIKATRAQDVGCADDALFSAAIRLLTNRAHADLARMFAKPTARVARYDGAPLRYDQLVAACARAPADVVTYTRGDGAGGLTAGDVHARLLADPETCRDAAQYLALRKLELLHVGHGTSFLPSSDGNTP
jgi:hypothetical protein